MSGRNDDTAPPGVPVQKEVTEEDSKVHSLAELPAAHGPRGNWILLTRQDGRPSEAGDGRVLVV